MDSSSPPKKAPATPTQVDPHAPTMHAGSGKSSGASNRLERGATLGRYVVLDVIGEGGMGVVYAAYDPELDRKVAVKLLRTDVFGGDGSDGSARLLREGQAMARLSHPNVVHVHDVGTLEGRVFVAMEWVDGETLRAWQQAERPWREIVGMYTQAGRGLAAAHDAGLVHRDFKPDNVLIGRDGRARVGDFGLARTGSDTGAPVESRPPPRAGVSALDTPITQDGTLLGTPRYMAPEQLSGERSDAPTDQFSFCASLYEALYREHPFPGETLIDLFTSVRSGKLRAPNRAKDVPTWVWRVVKRGLAADRKDRYPSMHALIAALEQDPAHARRRAALGIGGALVVALGATSVTLAMARRPPACPSVKPELSGVWDDATRGAVARAFGATGKAFAADAFQRVTRGLDSYAASWVQMREDSCRATLVSHEQSSELLDLRTACLDARLAGLRALTSQLAQPSASVQLEAVQAVNALAPISDCADAAALRAPFHLPSDPAERARIEAVRAELANLRALRDTTAPAVLVDRAHRATQEAKECRYRPLEAEALAEEGAALDLAHDAKGAVTTLEEAELTAIASHHAAIETQAAIDLVGAYGSRQLTGPGREVARRAHAYLDRDEKDEPRLATLLLNESVLADEDTKYDEALDLTQHALTIRQETLPADHPDIGECLNRLGIIAWRKGDFDQALDYHRRALEIRERAFGPNHPMVARSLGNIANALYHRARSKPDYDEAVRLFRRVLEIMRDAYGPEDPIVADTLNNLGNVLSDLGQSSEALDEQKQALAIRLRILGPDDPAVAMSYGNIALELNELGRFDESIENSRRRIDILERAHGHDYPLVALSLNQIALSYIGKHEPDEAIPYAEHAVHLGETTELSPEYLALGRFGLAEALRDAHRDATRIRDLVARARAEFVREGSQKNVDEIDAKFPTEALAR